jgi:hypothetical protein
MKPEELVQTFRQHWKKIALLSGVGLILVSWPPYQMERQLRGDRGAHAIAVVEGWRVQRGNYRGRMSTTYYVDYRFQVAGETQHGHYHCQCSELRAMREGDSIAVRYARADPDVSRPLTLPYDTTWLLSLIVSGVALLILGLHGVLRARFGDRS